MGQHFARLERLLVPANDGRAVNHIAFHSGPGQFEVTRRVKVEAIGMTIQRNHACHLGVARVGEHGNRLW